MGRFIALLPTVAAFVFAGASVCADPLFKSSEAVPSDAIVLFDGTDLSAWTRKDGKGEPSWKVENGYAEVRDGDIRTKQVFKDFQLHVEFWLPLMADETGQDRANSGVYLQGYYEIQVLDSYGLDSGTGDCGAIYNTYPPIVNACRPPEQWQSYDVFFRAPRFDADGSKLTNARLSVLQNGVWIHQDAELSHRTSGAITRQVTASGPIMLQDHDCPVRYRNIWIRPLH